MDVLLMCGGRGTRLRSDEKAGEARFEVEKPLVAVAGRPMVDRVVDALAASRAGRVHAVCSPHAPQTRERLAGLADAGPTSRDESVGRADVSVLDARGDGYVEDLRFALGRVETPVLTVVADVPLLAPDVVNRVLDVATEGDEGGVGPASLAVCVPASLKRELGASVDTTFEDGSRELAPTGVNVVAETDDTLYVTDDVRLAVNVNRPSDVALAEALCE